MSPTNASLPKEFIDKLSNYLQKHNSLEQLIQKFQTNFGLTPCIGVEIEFYLSKNINPVELENLLCMTVKQEKGDHQFEIDLPPSTDIISYITKINTTKSQIENIAKKLTGTVNFTPKPFPTDYGNSMHFHVNFLAIPAVIPAEAGIQKKCIKNAFLNNKKNWIPASAGMTQSSEGIAVNFLEPTDYIQNAQSICHYMLDSFLVFMPNQSDYLRLDKNFMAPTNVSFGNNNRTVAVRIPDLLPKRLEHRLSSPLTDPYIAIFTILKSIMLGLEFPDQINNLNKIYGNAFDQQYDLVPLPKSLSEALQLFKLEFYIEPGQQGKTALELESLLQIIKNL